MKTQIPSVDAYYASTIKISTNQSTATTQPVLIVGKNGLKSIKLSLYVDKKL